MTPAPAYLPYLVGPVATLIVVMLGVFFTNRHLDAQIGDMSARLNDMNRTIDARFNDLNHSIDARFNDMLALIKSESSRLEAALRVDIARLEQRVERLETQRLLS